MQGAQTGAGQVTDAKEQDDDDDIPDLVEKFDEQD